MTSSAGSRDETVVQAGLQYWETQPASLDGVLGAPYPASMHSDHVNSSSISSPSCVWSHLRSVHSDLPILIPGESAKRYRALDVGAGIGRVTADVLLHLVSDVGLLEPVRPFIEEAHRRCLGISTSEENDASGWTGIRDGTKSVSFFRGPLQDFDPAQPRRHTEELKRLGNVPETDDTNSGFDVVWCQWCLGHLNDEDLVVFLKRSTAALRNSRSLIVVKENLCSEKKVPRTVFDEEDSSWTRSDLAFKKIFEDVGLQIIRQKVQHGLPAGLYPVKMYVPNSLAHQRPTDKMSDRQLVCETPLVDHIYCGVEWRQQVPNVDTPKGKDPEGPPILVPEGFSLYTENNAHILISSKDEAFLNPVQEFNRDLSVACIRVWSEDLNREKEDKFKRAEERRAQRLEQTVWEKPKREDEATGEVSTMNLDAVETGTSKPRVYHPHKFVLLEALSATGLRSIRYAKEIPLVRFVIANDLEPSATAAMRRNVEINGLGPFEEEIATQDGQQVVKSNAGKVRVHEDDACALMYNHRTEKTHVDVVDLDPYGTAAPFIDAAVQAINSGGLLCVTCTDMSVLATTNYAEKCFSNYGGMPVKAEYSHEAALRLVLNTISTSASRYGRYIEPLLSLSIDFYVRIFVRVHAAPIEVKKAASKTAIYYVCCGCASFHEQKLGRVTEKTNKRSGAVNLQYKTATGPPVNSTCPECGFTMHLAGPMWSGPLHNPEFVHKVVKHVDQNVKHYGTSMRMKGMLSVAQEELDVPFYFTPGKVAGIFHCSTPSLGDVTSALLNGGHQVSRSHASAGSLKTTATRAEIHDVFRAWAQRHPVRMDRISEVSPAAKLLNKDMTTQVDFQKHPESARLTGDVKIVRYQQNPAPNWGPGSRAGGKRKREQSDESR
ncbi:N2,N2-dimethylguanosine tRNA methyltransferase-domain-containing protein [Chiua virens]|nr:N2,N2-dimethylguanosine tRNA methyltransferase-domain-containing protein [Chiua virens]